MEQQEVSVAKAGLVAALPARTTVLAAANPAEGHYNRSKSVAENLKISGPMLSRFDLLFVLLDRPDADHDARLGAHVMALHCGLADRAAAAAARQRQLRDGAAASGGGASGRQQQYCSSTGGASDYWATQGGKQGSLSSTQHPDPPPHPQPRVSLLQRLKQNGAGQQDGSAAGPSGAGDGNSSSSSNLLPPPLLRKYLSYARAYVHPTLGDDARAVLQGFYLTLRQGAAPGRSAPVTARQLESMVRLAEARARLELRPVVSRADAEDVVEIMREALFDKFGDGAGCLDFRTAQLGGGGGRSSKAKEAQRFLAALAKAAARRPGGLAAGGGVFTTGELYSLANDMALQVRDVGQLIESLNDAGELLKAGGSAYRLKGAPATAAPSSSALAAAMRSSSGTQLTQSQQQVQPPLFDVTNGSQAQQPSQLLGAAAPSQRFGGGVRGSAVAADHAATMSAAAAALSQKQQRPSQKAGPASRQPSLLPTHAGAESHRQQGLVLGGGAAVTGRQPAAAPAPAMAAGQHQHQRQSLFDALGFGALDDLDEEAGGGGSGGRESGGF